MAVGPRFDLLQTGTALPQEWMAYLTGRRLVLERDHFYLSPAAKMASADTFD